MKNLLAYVPVLNARHLDWFQRHRGSRLVLITQERAVELVSRLDRNMAAIPTTMMRDMIQSQGLLSGGVSLFNPGITAPEFPDRFGDWKEWVVADEDVSRLAAERYLIPENHEVNFEQIWARFDMTAVKARQEMVSDAKLSSTTFDRGFMAKAVEVSKRSPDWWRQVGAVLLGRNQQFVVGAYNTHFPNEYETYVFGDPGINRDAGQPGVYTVLHAERAVIAHCARYGIAMAGSDLFVTTFPCVGCSQEIIAAGVRRVFFLEGYSELNALDNFRAHKIQVIQVVSVPEQAAR